MVEGAQNKGLEREKYNSIAVSDVLIFVFKKLYKKYSNYKKNRETREELLYREIGFKADLR